MIEFFGFLLTAYVYALILLVFLYVVIGPIVVILDCIFDFIP